MTRRPADRPVRQDAAARGRPPGAPARPGRRSRRSPSWSARPSTCTPTGSPRWRCGTPGPPGTTPSRWSTRWSGSPATRCRSRCWSTSSTRWAATAGCSWSTTRRTAWCWSRWTARCWRRCCASKKIAPMLGARIDDDTVHRAPVRARPAQAGAAQARLAGRGPGRLRRRRGAPDRAARGRLDAARLPAPGRGRASGPAAPASWCCPAAPARRWSARPRWRRPRRPR